MSRKILFIKEVPLNDPEVTPVAGYLSVHLHDTIVTFIQAYAVMCIYWTVPAHDLLTYAAIFSQRR